MSRRLLPLLLALPLLLSVGACAPSGELVVLAPPTGDLDLSQARFLPAGAARVVGEARRDRVVLAVSPDASLRIDHPGACPEELRPTGKARREVVLRPLLDLGEDQVQLGYGAQFELVVRPGCERATHGQISWQVSSGPAMTVAPDAAGFHLRGRTPPFSLLHPEPVPWGIVPLSPATTGATTLVATWHGSDGGEAIATVRVAAAARASGLPSVPVGHRLLLGGRGWRVKTAPPGGKAGVILMDALATLTPDLKGRWVLQDGAGRELTLRVGRYDETPLDCGRPECHPAAHRASADNPMTRVLSRGLEGELRADYSPACAIACHAIGEPGLPDGGFTDVARALGFVLPVRGAKGRWSTLPRALRRLGGVGCTACHGPGAIPEANGRWAILRADVCAVCHDAPPRYGHVAAWRTNRMSRADASAESRDPACRTCHSTAGFLDSIGVRPAVGDWTPPASAEPFGITCAACHAAHGAHGEHALLRKVEPPRGLSLAPAVSAAAAICLRCHAPLDEAAVTASAASLWLGRGGLDPASGETRTGIPVHLVVRDGCIGCHAGNKDERAERHGTNHSFAVNRERCTQCHNAERPAVELPDASGRRVAERAQALWARAIARRLVPGVAGASAPSAPPLHAQRIDNPLSSPVERALHNVRMVLEDPAAGVHNGPYARALLDDAGTIIEAAAAR